MLSAVLDDLSRVPGVAVVTMLARDFAAPAGSRRAAHPCRRVGPSDEEETFRELAARADHTLVIAPESGGLLEERCRIAEEAGGRLLGPASAEVRLAADKLALAEHLASHDVPTPHTFPLADVLERGGAIAFPAVCKPRDGAGSQSTYLVGSRADLLRLRDAEPFTEFVVQPHAAGTPASVALLLGPLQCVVLPPALQHLSADGHFRYLGGRAPPSPALAERARGLARAAADALPALRGYVGIDLVLGDDPAGSGDRVIEINPRLTTSYVGLRALARSNLAETMLRVARGEPAPEPSWREGEVAWTADGRVTGRPADWK